MTVEIVGFMLDEPRSSDVIQRVAWNPHDLPGVAGGSVAAGGGQQGFAPGWQAKFWHPLASTKRVAWFRNRNCGFANV